MTYGERLRELRAERRLSLRQVEERGGPNKDTMSLIERDVHRPHPQTLGRIAEALDMDVSSLRLELTDHQDVIEREDNRTLGNQMIPWQVAFGFLDRPYPSYPLGNHQSVIEREEGRTLRTIGAGLSADEARAVANSRESIKALGDLWEAIHRLDTEGLLDSDLLRDELKSAFDVLMRANGVRS